MNVDSLPLGRRLLSPRPHSVVLADPPWYRTPCGTAKTPYPTMTWGELSAFPIGDWLARPGVLFVWTTGPTHLKECAVLSTWCERYKLYEAGIAFIWVKTRRSDGRVIGASGPRPKLVKQLGELVVAFTTQKRGRALPLASQAVEQYVCAPKPRRGAHSTKPPEVRDRIVELHGDGVDRVELFARDKAPGWNRWGHEAPQ